MIKGKGGSAWGCKSSYNEITIPLNSRLVLVPGIDVLLRGEERKKNLCMLGR